jgi:2-methylisocitrate lyase-like PEP mutase family enzyme
LHNGAIDRSGRLRAVYMTGAGTAATLGYPDYGLLTMSEMADNAGRIAASVDVPVIADADTGYGNELNATRTVREYERRGGLHIEDQGSSKPSTARLSVRAIMKKPGSRFAATAARILAR